MRNFLAVLLLLASAISPAFGAEAPVAWKPWNKATFAQAQREHKQVFLYLEAVWCHWCHVMQQETLQDPTVLAQLRTHYVAMRVDHDADPLLANRYRDWGWPALIFLAPDGTEIVKRAGYIAPADFSRLLQAIVADPSPEEANLASHPPGAAGTGTLTVAQRAVLLRGYAQHEDTALGGLDTAQKFLDLNTVEYGLRRAARGDTEQRVRVLRALNGARGLIDSVWGGVYQYSTGGDWNHPHYEKLMRVQARYLRLYAQAYALWHRGEDRDAARAIARYMLGFLRDNSGAFYVSQDADAVPGQKATAYFALGDTARRKLGVPRVDDHRYADANGQAIAALAYWSDVGDDPAALVAALQAAEWTLKSRTRGNGGFRHDAKDSAGPYLSDTLAMGEGLLALYRSTGDRRWLTAAQAAAGFVIATFSSKSGGFVGAVQGESPVKPVAGIAENIAVTRWLNLLAHYTGDASARLAAAHGMKFLTGEGVLNSTYEEAGILLADSETSEDPVHMAVVGTKADAVAAQMYASARATSGGYARLEWWDRTEGPLVNADVPYPKFPKAAGYVCSAGRCSAPSFTVEVYRERAIAAASR